MGLGVLKRIFMFVVFALVFSAVLFLLRKWFFVDCIYVRTTDDACCWCVCVCVGVAVVAHVCLHLPEQQQQQRLCVCLRVRSFVRACVRAHARSRC